MKQKRYFCLLLVVVLLTFLLAGCGPKETAPESSEAQAGDSSLAATEGQPSENQAPEGTPPDGQPGGTPPDGQPGGTPPDSQPGDTPPDGQPGGPGGNPPGPPPDGNGGQPGGTPPDGQPGGPGGNPPGPPPDGNGGPGGQPGGPGGMPPGGPGGSSADIEYKGAEEIGEAASQSGKTYSSADSDESALLIATDDQVEITDPTVTKSGGSSGGDACSFYGLNAAILVKDGAQVTVTGGTVTSDAEGANALFCYGGNGGRNGEEGDGTTLTVKNTKIRTSGGGSGGIMTTGGGVTYAYDLDVETSGRSSAPIRTDRGGGKVFAEGGTYVSNGLGSPVIYSTAEIHVANAVLRSNLSEGVCIEGKNSVELTGCDLTADNTERNSNARFLDSVMIYQSMSGDADSGTSSFTMDGGSLTSKSGHVFHVTNTNAIITLRGVAINNEDPADILLSVCGDGWSGAGNRAVLKAAAQELRGAIKVGDDSALSLELTEGSAFTGSIDGDITNAAGERVSTETGTVSVTLDEGSVWTLSADSWITEFHGDPSCVIAGGHTLYVDGTALSGTN